MTQPDAAPSELTDSVRRILDSGLVLLQSRLELFTAELQEEKLRSLEFLLWVAVGVVLGTLSLVMATATIVLVFWDTSPLLILSLLTLVYVVATVGVLWGLNRRAKAAPRSFADTIAEFNKDREWLQKKD